MDILVHIVYVDLLHDQFYMLSLEQYITDKFYIQWSCVNNGFLNVWNKWNEMKYRSKNKVLSKIFESNK
jgi:hypothetical protein